MPWRVANSATVASSRTASSATFALNAASNFRLDFFIIRSVYHNGTDRTPLKPVVPKTGTTSDTADVARQAIGILRNQPDRIGAVGLEDAYRARGADTGLSASSEAGRSACFHQLHDRVRKRPWSFLRQIVTGAL